MNCEIEKFGFGAILIEKNTRVLVASGIQDGNIINHSEIFNFTSNRWNAVSKVAYPTAYSSLCNFNKQFVYKFGGIDSFNKVCNLIERYDVRLDTWSSVNYDID